MDREQVALCILVATESGHAFSAFMPSYFTIHTFAHDSRDIENLRAGYAPAVAFNAALGVGVSMFVDSWLPLLVALGASGLLIAFYEQAIRKVDA